MVRTNTFSVRQNCRLLLCHWCDHQCVCSGENPGVQPSDLLVSLWSGVHSWLHHLVVGARSCDMNTPSWDLGGPMSGHKRRPCGRALEARTWNSILRSPSLMMLIVVSSVAQLLRGHFNSRSHRTFQIAGISRLDGPLSSLNPRTPGYLRPAEAAKP